MIIIDWNISLIEFVVKFCDERERRLKVRFLAFDDELCESVIKTLIIEKDSYIPDEIRQLIVNKIDSDAGYIIIKLSGKVGNVQLNNIKSKNYIFEADEHLG